MITINRYLSQFAPWFWTFSSIVAMLYLVPAYKTVWEFERRRPSNTLTKRTKMLVYLLAPLSVGMVVVGSLSIARWFLFPALNQSRLMVPLIFQVNTMFTLLLLLAVPPVFAVIGRMELRSLQGKNGQSHE